MASGYSTTPSVPSCWPLSWLLTVARVRTQVQRFHFHIVCVLLVFMETLKVTFQTPPTHPSIQLYHHSFNTDVFSIPLVPGTMLSHEDEDTAASKRPLSPTKKMNRCPHGAGLQVERRFLTPLPLQDLSAG